MLLGILLGLCCALAHALSYLASRRFLAKPGRSSRQLLSLSHILMGAMSLVLLPVLWFQPANGWRAVLPPLVIAAVAYLAGQACLFMALHRAPASRLSPLLGLKILFLAGIAAGVFGQELSLAQWAAVLLTAAAALCLYQTGGALPGKAALGILGACAFYAVSDLGIAWLIPAIDPARSLGASAFAVVLTYLLCGAIGLADLRQYVRAGRREWVEAAPFALAWYLSMVFLFATIAVAGVILAVILQSTRGPMSIVLAWAVARQGWIALEETADWRMRVRQIAAALLMSAAIGLYVWAPSA
jgi:uncharacterized membrane protein